jgi:regulator of sirC expression with transglutaminase-like and TPR domain
MVDNELKALVSLLDEPNELNYINIQNRIFSYGIEIIPVLEEVWENSFDELIQARVENLIHTINFNNIKAELVIWRENDSENLLNGFILVSKYQYPDLNIGNVIDKVNLIKKDMWLEINLNLTALEQIKVLNHVFFDIHNFKSNRDNPNSFNFLFINNLLETKKGTPLSLGVLYLILAQSLHLPIYGVDLPQNFILTYIKSKKSITKQDILFYINPFNKGIVFSIREIDLFLKQMNLDYNNDYYLPCTNSKILILILKAMKSSFLKDVDNKRTEEVSSLINILLKI